MPISNARQPKTQREKDRALDEDIKRRRENAGPCVISSMIFNSSTIHEWTDTGDLKYKIGNRIEIKGVDYKIKLIEREVEGNKIFRRYILER